MNAFTADRSFYTFVVSGFSDPAASRPLTEPERALTRNIVRSARKWTCHMSWGSRLLALELV